MITRQRERPGALRTLRSAWGRVMRLWRPLAGWTILVWVVATVLFVPASSALLGWGVFRDGGEVVGNEGLVAWALSLPGLCWLLLAGTFALVTGVLRYAGIYRILTDDMEGRRPGVLATARALAPELGDLLRLCAVSVLAATAVLVPLILGLLAIWRLMLWDHDINYYLAVRPPGWNRALATAAAWGVVWAASASWAVGRSLLALPAWVDGHRPLGRALRRSWKRSRGGILPLLRLVMLPVAAWLTVRVLVDGTVGSGLSWALHALQGVSGSLTLLAAATAAAVGLSLAVDAVVEFLGFSTVAAVLTRVYHRDTHLHAGAPSMSASLQEAGSDLWEVVRRRGSPGRLALVGTGLILASAFAGGALLEEMAEPEEVTVVAHRAGPAPAPENTLAALELAAAAGADFAEIDVQLTRDGVPVVAHDADLMRVAGDPRRIGASTWRELRGVVKRVADASSAISSEERSLATLSRFLERARGRIGLEIELKYYGRDTALAPAVVRAIRAHGMEEEVAVMSLELDGIRQLRRLAPEIRRGYAAAVTMGDLSRLPVDFLTVSRQRARPGLVRAAHDRGMDVHVWTVNRVPEMAEMVRINVDGLVTDRPDAAVRVREELAELPAAARLLLRFRPFRLRE